MLLSQQTELEFAGRSQTPPPHPGPSEPSPPPPLEPSPGEIVPRPGPDIVPPPPVPADMPPPVAGRRTARLALYMLIECLAAMSTAAANAQSATPPASPPATAPTTPPEIAPGHPGGGRPDLAVNNGVIHPPPNVGDTGINQQVPAVGAMPVIPPPGTPGGNQAVQPK